MATRWDSLGLGSKIGAPLGVLYNFVFMFPWRPARLDMDWLILAGANILGSVLGGAALLAIIVGARNLILRAK
jgi:hypothetical protein